MVPFDKGKTQITKIIVFLLAHFTNIDFFFFRKIKNELNAI